jgi:hypothetical protein
MDEKNLPENWRKPWRIAGLVFLAIIISVNIFYKPTYNSVDEDAKGYCFFSDKMKKLLINGVVKEKFRDKKNHLFPVFKLGDKEGQVINSVGEGSGFYDSLRVGDSLYKPSGSLEVKIYRDTSVMSWQLRYFDCE